MGILWDSIIAGKISFINYTMDFHTCVYQRAIMKETDLLFELEAGDFSF
jgi:hypothetical protein